MQSSAEESPKYLGAVLPSEKRLVLVPLDPREPWAAFRRLRAWMKQAKKQGMEARVDVFEAPGDVTQSAKVIPLERRTS